MNMRLSVLCSTLVFALVTMSSVWGQHRGGWEQIDASTPFEDDHGVLRTPSCSGGPLLQATSGGVFPVPAETDFSFFMRRGDPGRLLIIWDGGGACWETNTCILSALAGAPVYDLAIDETPATLGALGGLFDAAQTRNPVRNFTQVFIPYCTGDLHIGARDTDYPAPQIGHWPIHHRGYDNVVAVMRYLANYYDQAGLNAPKEIVLVGKSAGGYGVLYGYPLVAETFPWTKRVRVLVDSANGVITDDLYALALSEDGAWGARENLAWELEPAFDAGSDALVPGLFIALGWYHPVTRFGQYTRAYDATQVLFYNLARHVDRPDLWTDPTELGIATREWKRRARSAMAVTALMTWNYRYYLAAGSDHTIVPDPRFYTERSAGGVLFSNWFKDMVEGQSVLGSRWRNLTCGQGCLSSSLISKPSIGLAVLAE